jgi:hypothetical protein
MDKGCGGVGDGVKVGAGVPVGVEVPVGGERGLEIAAPGLQLRKGFQPGPAK